MSSSVYSESYDISNKDEFLRRLQSAQKGDQLVLTQNIELLRGDGDLDIPGVVIKRKTGSEKLHIEGVDCSTNFNAKQLKH